MSFNHTIKGFALLALISSAAYIDAKYPQQKKSTSQEKSNIKEIETQQEFDKYINGSTPVLVKFYSPNCGHCSKIAAPYKELANSYNPKEVLFLAVNGDAAGDAGQIAEDYNITGYPTFVFIKEKKVVKRQSGSLPSSSDIKQYFATSSKSSKSTVKKTEQTRVIEKA